MPTTARLERSLCTALRPAFHQTWPRPMHRSRWLAGFTLLAFVACADVVSPRSRSLTAIREPVARWVDSITVQPLAADSGVAHVRFFGACPADSWLVYGRVADSAIVLQVYHPPGASRRCESLLAPVPVGELPPDKEEGELAIVLRRPDESEQRLIVRTKRTPTAAQRPSGR